MTTDFVFLRERTAAALIWWRPLQLPADSPHGCRVLAPPRGQSDYFSLGNKDTVAPWWTLTGTLSPRFFPFNHLHKSTQALVSTQFVSNQPLSKDLRLGHAGDRADKMLFLIYKGQDELKSLGFFVVTWFRCNHMIKLWSHMSNWAPKTKTKNLIMHTIIFRWNYCI